MDELDELISKLPEDDYACAERLASLRWPGGFVCSGCGGRKAWHLETRPRVFECADCARQISVTSGTALHRSGTRLKVWFAATIAVATYGGVSARELARKLEARVETIWQILHKLRGNLPESLGLEPADVEEVAIRSVKCKIARRPFLAPLKNVFSIRSSTGNPGGQRVSTLEVAPDAPSERLEVIPWEAIRAANVFAFANERTWGRVSIRWLRRYLSQAESWLNHPVDTAHGAERTLRIAMQAKNRTFAEIRPAFVPPPEVPAHYRSYHLREARRRAAAEGLPGIPFFGLPSPDDLVDPWPPRSP